MIQQSHSWAYTQTKLLIHKDTCTPVFIAALFYNSQDMEITWIPINRWMDKEDVVCVYLWNTHRYREHTCSYQGQGDGVGEGGIRSSGLADENYSCVCVCG